MPIYRAKNWDKFQHYRDRTPPWIRLHRALLDDYEFHGLPDASRALAPCLWLLASEHPDPAKGEIDASDEKIAFRLRMPVEKFQDAVKPLIDNGFFEMEQSASTPLAPRTQTATTETETEEETEERESSRVTLANLSVNHIATWLAEQRSKGRYLHHDEHFVLEQLKNYCQAKGKRYANYLAAYRNAFEWKSCQPRTTSGDNRDPAARARDIGEEIIAKRAAARQAADQSVTAGAGRTDSPALSDIREPENVR
jgi:hypothetical protein